MTQRDEQSKLNVLFIVPTLRRAGAETQVIDLVNGFDDARFSKTLLVFAENVDQKDRLDERNIDFRHIQQKSKYDFSIIDEIAALIDEKSIDVIHCTLQISLLIGWLAKRKSKRNPKIVVAIHTTLNVSMKAEAFDRLLYRWLITRCDRVIFVCKTQAEHWGRKYRGLSDISTVVYNGIDTDQFSLEAVSGKGPEFRSSHDIPREATVVSCIAGFRKEKGHLDLLSAFADTGDNNYLVLAGEGPHRIEAEEYAASHDIQDRVIFLGNVADVRPVLAASDLTVLASTAVETFSIAMLESMSMEVPTLVTDIGGLAEAVVPGETGDIVPPGRPDKLAAALRNLLSNRSGLRKMGARARQRVITRFQKADMIENTADVLLSVAGRGRKGREAA
jgi:glycosyltransferase involved in cell wall biosynthesis